MKKMKIAGLGRAAVATSLLALSSTAFAAGPLAICEPGVPFAWGDGGANVPFNPDQGDLAILTNAEATARVTEAFQAWTDIPTATISYVNAGNLPVDVDETNFGPYLNATAPDGLSAIVYDDTGAIFEALFGPGSGVLGFAGPEWIAPGDCEILEGLSFLNGPSIGSVEGLLDLMVHEFGHYSNLAHTEVNGQLFIGVGDSSGPGDSNTFGFPPFPDGEEVIATMYPFLFGGIDQLSRTPHPDDIASISRIYPEPNYATDRGSITGVILQGATRVTGVNVIARNVDDPFFDAVSAISSDYTDDFSQTSEFTGQYTIGNLTPGANYAVYIDEILAGGFSTPLASPLPGPEEFWNGAAESSDSNTDIPTDFVPIAAVAGAPVEGIDILINSPPPNTPLNTGDDGTVAIPLPFSFCAGGQPYNIAYINGNGFLTLGAPPTGSTFSESELGMVSGPPRMAAFWDDLNVNDGGQIFYEQTSESFKVTWEGVPEFFFGGSNTASVELLNNSGRCIPDDEVADYMATYGFLGFAVKDVKIRHGDISSPDGIVGVSSGTFATSGFETEVDLTDLASTRRVRLDARQDAAIFERFQGDVDTAGGQLNFLFVGRAYDDDYEENNSVDTARGIELPFISLDTKRENTQISPSAADIDWFRPVHQLEAGQTLIVETLTGQVDTVLTVLYCPNDTTDGPRSKQCDPTTAIPIAFNDDFNGLLSRIEVEVPVTGTYVIGVTFCCDYDFDGVDPGQGAPFDEGRYVLEVYTIDGVLLPLSDESFEEYELGFDFPFNGETYSSVFVNSNGYLSFGSGETFNFFPNVFDWELGLPRAAPLWVDLDPGAGGMVLANGDSTSATFSFMDVPEFFFGGSNTFFVTIDASGAITYSYSGMTAPEGITGVTSGDGSAGTAIDISAGDPTPATGTTYELFDFFSSPFDLDGSAVTFED